MRKWILVKRNTNRFPKDFRFQLTELEYESLRCQFGISKEVYHIGASLKDAGKKCFAINKIEDKIIVADILNRLSPKEGGE